MKILWYSTAPWGKISFSKLTKEITPKIQEAGHRVTIGAWYGIQGESRKWNEIEVIPIAKNWRAFKEIWDWGDYDVSILCDDSFRIPPEIAKETSMVMWSANHHIPPTRSVLLSMQASLQPFCYSQWGTDVLRGAGVENAKYCPCPVDTKKFFYVADAKKQMQIDNDVFLVSMVATNNNNMDRKGFAEAFQAFAKFNQKHPSSVLFCHTAYPGVVNLQAMSESLGLGGKILFPNQYMYNNGLIEDDFLRLLYSASDVYLCTSKWEGFNLPLVEAQACHCPVIAPDWGPTSELLFRGWKVDGQLYWQNDARSWGFQVYIDSVHDCLEQAYRNRSKKPISGIGQFEPNEVFNTYWKPALESLAI